MIHQIKRHLAVRSYARRLGQDLGRRFGRKPFYSIEQVTQAVQRGKFSAAFIAYAHAAFCSEPDFDAYYQSTGDFSAYRQLRRTIARRYLRGQMAFDAQTIIRRFRTQPNEGEFYESGMGEDYPRD